MASVDINIVGSTPPFGFSVKDEFQVERFLSYSGGKIYFSDIQDNNNHTYTVTVTKNNCTVVNDIILYNCGSSTPTPTAIAQCIAPLISLTNINNRIVTIAINAATSNCTTYQFQYSTSITFNIFNSVTVSCNTQQYIEVPSNGVWYFRVLKTCDNNSTTFSNVISATINSNVPVPISTCNNCRNVNVYGAYSSWEISYLDCDNNPSAAYGVPGGATTICACESSIETISGDVILTDLGSCNSTPTPVPLPIPVPVSQCTSFNIEVATFDLEQADGSTVFVDYIDCNNITHTITFMNPGTYTGYCGLNGTTPYIYYYYLGNPITGQSVFNQLTPC